MIQYERQVEGNQTFYTINLGNFNGSDTYLDLTNRAKHAIRRDVRRGYESENGPEFGIEVLHALEYAEYVSEHGKPEDIHKFGTRDGYSIFFKSDTPV
jgi:hypothetical protein